MTTYQTARSKLFTIIYAYMCIDYMWGYIEIYDDIRHLGTVSTNVALIYIAACDEETLTSHTSHKTRDV